MNNAGLLIGGAFIVLVIIITGFAVLFGGSRGMEVLKAHLPTVLIGSALLFGAFAIGAWLASTFSV